MAIEDFILYLRTEKRYSDHSVKAYRSDLLQFQQFASANYSLADIADASEKTIRSWIAELKQEELDNNSINRKQSALRAFFHFLLQNNRISQHPMARMKALRSKKRVAVFVPISQMQKVGSNQTTDDYTNFVKSFVVELFYQTGMRISELHGLKTTDIDLVAGLIKVHGKRNKQRLIPISAEFSGTVMDYQRARNNLGVVCDASFIVKHNGRQPSLKWIYNAVNQQLSESTTLSKTSPHVLRHTFATHLLNNGANILAVKELLGHASLAATQVYTHNTIDQLKKIHKQAHPKGE